MTDARREMDRGYVAMGGTRLYYEAAGSGDPVVLIHPGFADRRVWDRQWDCLAEEYRVVRYDVRGTGKSAGSSAPYSDYADLEKLIDFLGVQRAHFVGLATGGSIALDLAVDRPEVVESLVLVSTSYPGVRPSAVSERRRREAQAAYTAGRLDQAVEAILRAWVDGPGRTPEQVDTAVREHVRLLYSENLPRQEYQGRHNPMNPPAVARLDEVHAPTLVVVGEFDAEEERVAAEAYAAGISTSAKIIMPGAGHMVPLEQSEVFNRVLLKFFSLQVGDQRQN
jgi:3-oxoadipate enol-lactonase